jgi:hypothetical protein
VFRLHQPQPAVFLAPAVLALLTDDSHTNGLRHCLILANQYHDLTQPDDNLFRGKCLSWHIKLIWVVIDCLSITLDWKMPVRSSCQRVP